MANPASVAFRQTAQRVPVPSDGWGVVLVEEIATAGTGILLQGGQGDERSGAHALRLIATSGIVVLPNGMTREHGAKPGDLVFPRVGAMMTPSHPLWPANVQCVLLVDITSHIPDEAARLRYRAAESDIAIPERAPNAH